MQKWEVIGGNSDIVASDVAGSVGLWLHYQVSSGRRATLIDVDNVWKLNWVSVPSQWSGEFSSATDCCIDLANRRLPGLLHLCGSVEERRAICDSINKAIEAVWANDVVLLLVLDLIVDQEFRIIFLPDFIWLREALLEVSHLWWRHVQDGRYISELLWPPLTVVRLPPSENFDRVLILGG